MAVIFVITSLSYTYVTSSRPSSESTILNVKIEEPQVPAKAPAQSAAPAPENAPAQKAAPADAPASGATATPAPAPAGGAPTPQAPQNP